MPISDTAPSTSQMIEPTVSTVWRIASRAIFQRSSPRTAATTRAPTAPIAAASVTVAMPE